MTRRGAGRVGMSRRDFGRGAATLAMASLTGACGEATDASSSRRGRLDARPSATSTRLEPGVHRIAADHAREGLLRVPSTAARGPVPLLVLFHGAGGSADGVLRLVRADAVSTRAAILATNAASATWDALTPEPRTVLDMFDVFGDRRLSGFGPDAACLQSALTQVFRDVAIDAGKIAIGGFSDGATYALSLGLSNGELFRRIVAFAPGFILDGDRHGQPEVFISHGRRDAVLPIQRTSRRIVQTLRQHGYSVIVREFDGGHEVPAHIAREALEWAIG